MRIDIITALPDLLKSPFETSILKKSIDLKLIDLHIHNLRDFTKDNYKTIDDNQFGGGAGMVMMIEPIKKCIDSLKKERIYDEVIYMTPDGEMLSQKISNRLSLKGNLIILCGHYKGVDQRVRDSLITKEISIGNYVLSGGELPAAVLCDSIIRLIPGVLGNPESLKEESHSISSDDLILVEYPNYTKPANWRGIDVPEVLLSGNHGQIAKWRLEQAERRTNQLNQE